MILCFTNNFLFLRVQTDLCILLCYKKGCLKENVLKGSLPLNGLSYTNQNHIFNRFCKKKEKKRRTFFFRGLGLNCCFWFISLPLITLKCLLNITARAWLYSLRAHFMNWSVKINVELAPPPSTFPSLRPTPNPPDITQLLVCWRSDLIWHFTHLADKIQLVTQFLNPLTLLLVPARRGGVNFTLPPPVFLA